MDSEEKITQEQQARFDLLKDLIVYLTKITIDDLKDETVEAFVEGFWISKQNEALAETIPFGLKGE